MMPTFPNAMKGDPHGCDHSPKTDDAEISLSSPGLSAPCSVVSHRRVQHCGFQPRRPGAGRRDHNVPDIEESIRYLEQSASGSGDIQIRPEELASALKAGQKLQLLDVRTPEEHKTPLEGGPSSPPKRSP